MTHPNWWVLISTCCRKASHVRNMQASCVSKLRQCRGRQPHARKWPTPLHPNSSAVSSLSHDRNCFITFILQNTRQWQTVFVFATRFGVLASGTTNVKLDGMNTFHVTNSGLDGVIPIIMITVFGTNPTTCNCKINCNIAHFCFYQLRRAMWQTQANTQGALILQKPNLSIKAPRFPLRR